MPNLENLTRFEAVDLPSMDRLGNRLLLICVAGRFALPEAGKPSDIAPAPAAEQQAPVMEDEYFGDPGTSSLRREGQTAYTRPGTDIYMTGHACAPLGQSVTSMLVALRVGSCHKRAVVTGDRVWGSRIGGTRLGRPEPFERMPLIYERAFGGSIPVREGRKPRWEPRNPVGCGLYENGRAARDNPAPNIEDPDSRVTRLRSRPAPCGFGPIARNWLPRLSFAGTYDESWVETRAPLWPDDFDERFFCAASPGLNSGRPLSGGEAVHLDGVSPDGAFEFSLPTHHLAAKAMFRGREERRLMKLDAVHFEPDDQSFTMTWRVAFGVGRDLAQHQVSIIRELESWEELPE